MPADPFDIDPFDEETEGLLRDKIKAGTWLPSNVGLFDTVCRLLVTLDRERAENEEALVIAHMLGAESARREA